jgi:large subunit ribosomal protein L22
MDVRASAQYLPISPQKIRLVCDQVRGMNPMAALDVLNNMPQKGAPLVWKVVKSAVSNAENNFEIDPAGMFISQIYANEGPRRQWRRFGARGRFKPWIRRTAHVTVVLSEREEAAPAAKPARRTTTRSSRTKQEK